MDGPQLRWSPMFLPFPTWHHCLRLYIIINYNTCTTSQQQCFFEIETSVSIHQSPELHETKQCLEFWISTIVTDFSQVGVFREEWDLLRFNQSTCCDLKTSKYIFLIIFINLTIQALFETCLPQIWRKSFLDFLTLQSKFLRN